MHGEVVLLAPFQILLSANHLRQVGKLRYVATPAIKLHRLVALPKLAAHAVEAQYKLPGFQWLDFHAALRSGNLKSPPWTSKRVIVITP